MKLDKSPILFLAATLISLLFTEFASAGSATWNLNPTSGDWLTAANWTPAVVPNGAADTATFSSSTLTAIFFSRVRSTTRVDSIVFDASASAFSITADPMRILKIVGTGVVNEGSSQEEFMTLADASGLGTISFEGNATAGTMALYTSNGTTASATAGGSIEFHDFAIAGNATFVTNPGTASLADGGQVAFFNNSSADHGTFTNNPGMPVGTFGSFGGFTLFFDTARAGEGTFINNGGTGGDGSTRFVANASADHATFINNPATGPANGGEALFSDTSSADNATCTNNGSAVSGAWGGRAFFNGGATAANGSFINQGAVGVTSFHAGARTEFFDLASAATSTLTANGGTDGGVGAIINFAGDSDGGTARAILVDNGSLQISTHNSPGMTIGSVEGNGIVLLGGLQLSIGNNSLSTTFSGVIQDGGEQGGTGGSILKLGPGTLTLTGASTYTGGTIVSEGSFVVGNETGSATGTGAVQVEGGTLGGGGIITGDVTVGTGTGSGAVLSPSIGTRRRTTLRVYGSLTFKADATYGSRLHAESGKADKVIVPSVTIEDGAEFFFIGGGGTTIAPGTVFTLINNTGAGPIAGTFSNLADGSIVEHGGSSFQVSYEGGDGNDLTLTVVP